MFISVTYPIKNSYKDKQQLSPQQNGKVNG